MAHTQYCSAPNCSNSRGKCPSLSFFGFPKDQVRCKKWLENCNRPELMNVSADKLHRSRALCSAHFEDSQFMNAQSRNRLIWTAIPTLFDVPNSPRKLQLEMGKGTTIVVKVIPHLSHEQGDFDFPIGSKGAVSILKRSLEKETPREEVFPNMQPVTISTKGDGINPAKVSNVTLPVNNHHSSGMVMSSQQLQKSKSRQVINRQRVQLWRLKKQVDLLKSRVPVKEDSHDTVEKIISGASKYISGIAFSFFANQLRIASKKKQGKRWTKDDKLFALSLNTVSAEAYHLCSKVFSLPTLRTLRRWQQCFKKQENFEELELNPFKERLLGKTQNNKVFETDQEPNSSENTTNITADDQLILDALNQCLHPNILVPAASGVENEENGAKQMANEKEPTNETNFSNGQITVSGKKQLASMYRNSSQKRRYLIPHVLSGKKMKSCLSSQEPQQFELQVHSDQIDEQTLELIANVSNMATASNAITAIQETNSEGEMMLTQLTDGVPITLSEGTINLEIVTLGTSGETLNVLGFA